MNSHKNYSESYQKSQYLILGLGHLPESWALTPVNDSKRPYRSNWQSEKPLSRGAIARELRGRARGYGIRTGEISGGILAIDVDGLSAEPMLMKLSNGDLPDTVTFSSGKPGRRQMLYYVPPQYWGVVKAFKLLTGIKGEDGKEEQLDFRWDGQQSVLPPSVHPETGSYHWVRSPQEIGIANCPMWLLDLMIERHQAANTPRFAAPTPTQAQAITGSPVGSPPLEIYLGRDDRSLVESGTGNGARNDAAQKLSLNLVATARRLDELSLPYSGTPRQLYDDFCSRCTPPLGSDVRGEALGWWKNAEAIAKHPSLDDEKLRGCYEAWLKKQQPLLNKNVNSVQSAIVNVDNGVLSTPSVDHKNGIKYTFEAIVTTVNAILGSTFSVMDKSSKIDELYIEISGKQKFDRKVFDRIVATETLKAQELASSEKQRLEALLSAGGATINWSEVLPASLARDMCRDAEIRNIDPVVLWQSLLPSVASLIGVRCHLDVESHKIPAITWTATVLETGGGKSRGDDLIFYPLRERQARENARYQEAQKQFQFDYREWEKGGHQGDEPAAPTFRKFIFDIATIQAVVKRLSEVGDNGAVWARDELDGLFKSLGQFAKGGSDEGLQILLKVWNGGVISSDRVSINDSFFVEDSALSLSGGIQPGVFRKLFQDPEDSNGLQARFLFAVPQRLPQKKSKGYCSLSEKLPLLYDWLAALPQTNVTLSPKADALYGRIIDLAEAEYTKATNASERAWLAKWATHIMRIALILHAIESFYSNCPGIAHPLGEKTLERALTIGQYYRASFQFLQEKVSTSDELSTILLQIIDRARQAPAGITLRDTYRAMRRSLEPLAKESGVDIAVYTEQLFQKAETEGYCKIVRSGRSVKLVANNFTGIHRGSKSVDNVDNEQNSYGVALKMGIYSQSKALTMPVKSVDKSVDNGIKHVEHVVYPVIDITNISEKTPLAIAVNVTRKSPEIVKRTEEEPFAATDAAPSTSQQPNGSPNGQNELPVATPVESRESVTEFAPQIPLESTAAIPSVEPQAEELGAAFKVGDRVTISDPYSVRFNQIGEVSKVVSDELFPVSWTDECDKHYEAGDLSAI
ncbi:Primase 2 [Nostoc carneum NIES-2107]|nr:Primase 2 [Nostoc carneum NIES-2107]